MHYATDMNRIMEIQEFLKINDTVLIIDESHWIKNPALKREAWEVLKKVKKCLS